jgi:hypothetical protein
MTGGVGVSARREVGMRTDSVRGPGRAVGRFSGWAKRTPRSLLLFFVLFLFPFSDFLFVS